MKSADSSLATLFKRIGIHSANLVEALSTGICSIAAFVCLIVLDGWLLKLGGVVGCLVLICFIIYLSDVLKAKVR